MEGEQQLYFSKENKGWVYFEFCQSKQAEKLALTEEGFHP